MPFNFVTTLEDLLRERRRDVSAISALEQGKLPGRIRTGQRDVPANAADVIAGDGEGDVITDGTYRYELINDSGTLLWDRRTTDTGW